MRGKCTTSQNNTWPNQSKRALSSFLLVFVLFFVFVFVFSFFRESHLKPLVDALAVELVAARENSHNLS